MEDQKITSGIMTCTLLTSQTGNGRNVRCVWVNFVRLGYYKFDTFSVDMKNFKAMSVREKSINQHTI